MVKYSLRLSNNSIFGGGVTSKSLVVAALTGLVTIGATNSAQASETPVTPTLGENSAYTLDTNIQNSNNVITKYTYDNTGITGAVDYEVKLNQSTYGTGNAQQYYKWESTEKGIQLVETDKNNAQITANYSNDNLINEVINIPSYEDGSIPSEINGNFVGMDSSGLILYETYYSEDGSIVTNSINADMVNNTITDTYSHSLINTGGLSFDKAIKIGDYTGDIISNDGAFIRIQRTSSPGVDNFSIGSISGDYINNSGALIDIYFSMSLENGKYYSSVGDIKGNFIGNTGGVIKNSVSAFLAGGSTVLSSTIGNISGNFIGNTSTSDGGAICNYGDLADSASIGNVTGDFIANSVINKSDDTDIKVSGGAIYNGGNDAVIESVTGDFIGNYAYSESGSGDITNTRAVGGALFNSANISSLTGNFISNYVKSTGKASGGAMHNSGSIDNFNVDYFINNKAESTQGMALGGALYSSNKLGESSTLTSDFVKNTAIGHTEAYGGAIFSNGLSTVNANFIENSVINNNTDSSSLVAGGALANGAVTGVSSILSSADDYEGLEGLILLMVGGIPPVTGDIQGNYINNYAKANGGDAMGGAISNIGLRTYMQSVNANLQGNYASSVTGNAMGGALYSTGNIGSVAGNFVNNYVSSQSGNAMGGAVYSDIITYGVPLKQVQDISNFYMLLASEGGIIHVKVKETGQVVTLYSKDIKEYIAEIDASGMYVANSMSMDNIPYEEISLEEEGLTEAEFNAQIQDMIASGDYVLDPMEGVKVAPIIPGNLIYKDATFVNNRALSIDGNAYGGAIYTKNNIALPSDYVMVVNITDADGNVIKTLYATSGNHSKEDLEAGVKAKFTLAEPMTVTLEEYMSGYEGCTTIEETIAVSAADGTNILEVNPVDYNDDGVVSGLVNSSFIGNHAESTNGEAKGGAIYSTANLNIVADNGVVEFTDNYTLSNGVKDDNAIYLDNSESILNLNILNKGTVILNDNIDGQKGYNVNISGDNTGVLHIYNDIRNADVSIGNITVNTLNNLAHTYNFNSLTVLNDTNLLVDVDLANKTMDRFTASEYGSHSGNLNVVGMNLLSDAVDPTTEILFAEKGLKDNVTYGGADLPNLEYQTSLYTPIYRYNVSYDNREDAGYFTFTRPSSGSGSDSVAPSTPSVEAFNPAVLGGSTSATVGATATMNTAFNYAFQSSADYMNIPYLERVSMKNRNKYALSVTGDATDMGRFSPLYQPSDEEASVWVKPYATFETVGLKNGPKVHNNTYGTLVGFDTEMQSIKNGWDRVFTGYIGYNGASQRYAGVDSTQNGGLLGGTMTLYKGNFFNATTVSVGASVANNQTMYGSEDFAMLLSGIGNKTGYNFEFKEGKVILQPSMLMSYTFVNTFDYTNAAGVRIDNKPLHALQLAPGVKVIGNLKNGWQPYASVQMVWNLMGESNATANGVKLPEMSIKPYVQYGVGLQKRIKDHFTAYGQAMVQNGGRNGVSLTAGFRWALGHDNCKYKVDKSGKSVNGHSDENQNLTMKQVKSSNGEILNQVQDDSKCHYEEQSDVVIPSNNAIATPSARNDKVSSASGKKILKQLSPEQKMALGGGKYQNTSRTTKSGSLRQY